MGTKALLKCITGAVVHAIAFQMIWCARERILPLHSTTGSALWRLFAHLVLHSGKAAELRVSTLCKEQQVWGAPVAESTVGRCCRRPLCACLCRPLESQDERSLCLLPQSAALTLVLGG